MNIYDSSYSQKLLLLIILNLIIKFFFNNFKTWVVLYSLTWVLTSKMFLCHLAGKDISRNVTRSLHFYEAYCNYEELYI